MKCFRPGCEAEGTKFPIIYFGIGAEKMPYKLEVPQTVCEADQATLNPFDFIGDVARQGIENMLRDNGQPAPSWDFMQLDWGDPDTPEFREIQFGGLGRLWWADAEREATHD